MNQEKTYYSISEVSEMTATSQPTLRFWEKEFADRLRPRYSAGGTRRYTADDIETIKLIKFLLKERHLSIEGARQALANSGKEEERRMKVIHKLKEIKTELQAIRHELNDREALAEEIIID